MRKTKIVCTLGPSTDDENVLREMIREGMDVARFNFSHGTHKEQLKRLKVLRRLRDEEDRPIAALLDTKGPEIRLKTFVDNKVHLDEGQTFTLTSREVEGTKDIVSISYKDLPSDVSVGTRILIDDGLIEMFVEDIVDGTDIVCKVVNGGYVSNKKGVNVPGVDLSMPFISEQDREDILFGIEEEFDFIAASFVRNAGDILKIRRILEEQNNYRIKIIAKIENMQGVENIDDIIQVSDGIMVARGDMGVEIPSEEVPIIQKMIIQKVYNAGKQVITATQMLDSMIKNPRPTRAETADVANAIYDGTSAIMLSGETAAGLYPIESLKMMAKIAERTERAIDYTKIFFQRERKANPNVTDAICHATCTTAHDLKARAILTVTKSGGSARMISKYRPQCDIIAGATYPYVCRQMNMSWGVKPILIDEEQDVFELFDHSINQCVDRGYLKRDDLVVMTAGVPLGMSGTTNMLKVQVVGRKY
ncbi:MAG: pyruvate kinase [Lachnospiraceae bacterium]|nr:pyruvate kinase [Lachnospiraceae bacterium]